MTQSGVVRPGPPQGRRTTPAAAESPDEDDTDKIAIARRALRRVASGVTVLTVNHDGQLHGATVSSVVAISRQPIVLGAGLRPASMLMRLVEKEAYFSINVLGTGQAWLAARFADPARPPGAAQFDGLSWVPDEHTGAPLIQGCIAHISCRLTEARRVGDHDLLLAAVVGGRPQTGEPLLSFAGQLHLDYRKPNA